MKNDFDYEIPESIRMETENYKNENDIIGQWIFDCWRKQKKMKSVRLIFYELF